MRSKLATLFLATLAAGSCVLAGASPASATESHAATESQYGKSKWISAERGWQHAGVYVEPGDLVRIYYVDGHWTVDRREFPYVSSGGYPRHIDRRIYQECKILSRHPHGTLIAKVNSDHYRVGSRGSIRVREAGFLQLRINDADGCLGDNDGAVRVKIVVTD
ncbi:hypothetical protein ITP53_07960 [Nonomuraea sp. K274]|uniref:Uncharacterized protein n=1 Tax=Nonomuraea cypriaca TaxID=1187855 RepID=A0A931EVI0_9ACTN|nr:hypothetical protein [Nonomuraea cypriaca]MBF8185674.1 hypothetical protein [Nonomuraea cypriaca]